MARFSPFTATSDSTEHALRDAATWLPGAHATLASVVDAGLELAIVAAAIAAITAIVGLPRWDRPTCRSCGADLRPRLSARIVDVSESCSCGAPTARPGAVRWRGARRMRPLIVVALVIGTIAGGLRAWSASRAARDLQWRDLMPTESIVQTIEGTRSAPFWLQPGSEAGEFDRRHALDRVEPDHLRRVLERALTAPWGWSPFSNTALRVLAEGPPELHARAAALIFGTPELTGDGLRGPVGAVGPHPSGAGPAAGGPFWDGAAGSWTVAPPGGGWRPPDQSGPDEATLTISQVNALILAPVAVAEPQLHGLVQVIAFRQIVLDGEVIWSADEPRERPAGVPSILVRYADLIVAPGRVFSPPRQPSLTLRGLRSGERSLEIEILTCIVDRILAEAMWAGELTVRDLKEMSRELGVWSMSFSTTLTMESPADNGAADAKDGASPP